MRDLESREFSVEEGELDLKKMREEGKQDTKEFKDASRKQYNRKRDLERAKQTNSKKAERSAASQSKHFRPMLKTSVPMDEEYKNRPRLDLANGSLVQVHEKEEEN